MIIKSLCMRNVLAVALLAALSAVNYCLSGECETMTHLLKMGDIKA